MAPCSAGTAHITGADAPSAAALRLEQKNRLAELEAELEGARATLAEAEADLTRAGEAIRAETQRQQAAREAQRNAKPRTRGSP